MTKIRHAVIAMLAALLLASSADARRTDETLLLQQPAVSASHVVFVYAQDLWIVGRDGGVARRLTSDIGDEMSPRFSPDGRHVAFSAQYEGNTDVYVISVDGGAPRRLTWHPGGDVVQDWHPDGQHILFSSNRDSGAPVRKLFTVHRDGGTPEALAVPRVAHATYNRDASKIAYTPYADAFRTWKRYRGGRVTEIWIYDTRSHDVEVVPHVNASDTFPCWVGEDLYYASDRDGQMNLWKFRPGSASPTQITHFTDFDIRNMSSGGGVLAYEQAGAIHLYDPSASRSTRLNIRVLSDGLASRARWENVGRSVRSASIAPNGKRAVFEARGEILTAPYEHGDIRNITQSPGAHDRSPVWSPDGEKIAWMSDASGEYQLMIRDRLGREEAKAHDLGEGGFFRNLVWSPDGKHILFTDKTNRTAYLTLESGEVTDVVRNQGSLGELRAKAVWSPDSDWIAYEYRNPETSYDKIMLFSVADKSTTPVTDAFAFASDPAFSGDGKHLFFSASVDVGPRLFGLDMNTSAVRQANSNLYVAVLKADGDNPLAPRSDEAVDDKKKKDEKNESKEDEAKSESKKRDPLSGTWNGTLRGPAPLPPNGLPFTATLALAHDNTLTGNFEAEGVGTATIEAGTFDPKSGRLTCTVKIAEGAASIEATLDGDSMRGKWSLPMGFSGELEATREAEAESSDDDTSDGDAAGDEGEETDDDKEPSIDVEGIDQRILALPLGRGSYAGLACTKDKLFYIDFSRGAGSALKSFDFTSRKEKTVASGVRSVSVSADGKWLLTGGSTWSIMDANGGKKKSLDVRNAKIRVDPAEEWPQILREVWRIERDYFYDPNMHGVDWDAMWTRWSAFLPHVAHRDDLNVLIAEMIGELACGHNYVGGGDAPRASGGVSTGLLGADVEADSGRFRITRIYDGQNWNPGLRAPLTEPGVDVNEGDYIIRVNGRELTSDDNYYEAFADRAGKQVSLTVSAKADGSDERTSTVVPVGNEGGLRRLAWIEDNRRRVDELSDGRLAYIYMPNTGGAGMASFDRDFYSQVDREGLILDERFNGGGKVADYVIDVLSRDVISYWMNREQWLARSPFATLDGPKVMVINESAGSGGDWMPWAFQKTGIGKLVGRRTWGGLVGISGYPPLMDGGSVTAASFGVMDADGKWAVENVGASPDYEVTQWPKAVIAGGDPQLEKAVEVALAQLEKHKPKETPTYYPPTER